MMPYAHGLRLARACERHRLAVIEEFAGIAGVDTGKDFHQRRFAGAVFAH